MDQPWLRFVKDAILRVAGLKRYWKLIVGFVGRVALLNETREAKQVENMTRYLESVSKYLAVMRKNGCSDDEIRRYAVELNVPLIQANLEAMIVERRFSIAGPDGERPKPLQGVRG